MASISAISCLLAPNAAAGPTSGIRPKRNDSTVESDTNKIKQRVNEKRPTPMWVGRFSIVVSPPASFPVRWPGPREPRLLPVDAPVRAAARWDPAAVRSDQQAAHWDPRVAALRSGPAAVARAAP